MTWRLEVYAVQLYPSKTAYAESVGFWLLYSYIKNVYAPVMWQLSD